MKTVLLMLLCSYYVKAFYNETIESKLEDAEGVPIGDYRLQKITVSKGKVDPCFILWMEKEKKLIYTDSLTDKGYCWEYDTGIEHRNYYAKISGEKFVFYIPFRDNKTTALIGSNKNIRIGTYSEDNESKVEISDPVIRIKERGFCIGKAHCDKDGILYFLVTYTLKLRNTNQGSRLYRLNKGKAEKVHTFESKANDFVFSNDWKKLYVITLGGFCVDAYNIDLQTGELSNKQKYFDITSISLQTGANMKLESIEIDNHGNLFMIAGMNLIRVPPSSKEVDKIVQLPEKPTALTFGGYKSRNIFISTAKGCNHNEIQGGAIFAVIGLNTAGQPDPLFAGL